MRVRFKAALKRAGPPPGQTPQPYDHAAWRRCNTRN
jgi:hypothetical protein